MPKFSKEDYITFFNGTYDKEGLKWSMPQWSAEAKRLFNWKISGVYGLPPDVDLFLSDHKNDPLGATKFAKYMLQQRPSGHYWMKREKPKSDAEMKDIFKTYRGESAGQNKKSKLIESAITKIVRRVLNESMPKFEVGHLVVYKKANKPAKVLSVSTDSYEPTYKLKFVDNGKEFTEGESSLMPYKGKRYAENINENSSQVWNKLKTSLFPYLEKKYKMDIGGGHLGNGITVWDRNREEHRDYMQILHIGEQGQITIYDKKLKSDPKVMALTQ